MKSRYLFFTFFASQALPGRFSSLFFQAHGLSPSQIGILFGFSNLMSVASTPIFSIVADKSKSRVKIVLWLQILSTIFFSSLILALPSVGIIPESLRFPYILVIRTIYAFFARPIITIITAVCVVQLKNEHGKTGTTKFGKERLWGTVSWAIFSLLQGGLLDITHMNVTFVYAANFLLSLFFISTLISFHNSNEQNNSDEQRTTANSQSNLTDEELVNRNTNSIILLIRTTKSVIFSGGLMSISFFLLVACLSMGANVVAMLQFLYFFNELNASAFMCGIAVFVTVLFEVPLFSNAPELLQKYGCISMMIVAALAYGVRAIGYAFIPKGWYVLILEPLHGVTFAAMQTAGVEYVSSFALQGADATAQSVFTLIRILAGVVGVSIGGVVMEYANGRVLYFGYGVLVIIATIIFIVVRSLHHENDISDVNDSNNQRINVFNRSAHIIRDEHHPLLNSNNSHNVKGNT